MQITDEMVQASYNIGKKIYSTFLEIKNNNYSSIVSKVFELF